MENKKKFTCDLCKFNTYKPSDWIRHNDTAKHKRGGFKPKKCDICNMEFFSHWNYKYHNLTIHSTLEERQQQKYYCNDCDQVFFCSLYMQKHMDGKKHKNYVLALKLEDELKNRLVIQNKN
jgi:hypothetical protein